MGVYILFIFLAPFAITGIAYEVGLYSSVKPQSHADYYIATFLVAVLLFFVPLQWVDSTVYGLWLFWAGIVLSVGYFVARSHREELWTNAISRLVGGFAILIILIGSFVAIYPEKVVYDDSATAKIIKSLRLKPVKDNLRTDTTCEFKDYVGYVRRGDNDLFKVKLDYPADYQTSYHFYKDIGIFSHSGVDIIDMRSGETIWQQKMEPYSGGIAATVIGSLLILYAYEQKEMPADQMSAEEHLFAVDLNKMNIRWDKGIRTYTWQRGKERPTARTFFSNKQMVIQGTDKGILLLDPISGQIKYHFEGNPYIVDATTEQLTSYDSNQLSGWDVQSSRLIWQHKVDSLTFVYNHYAMAMQLGKILVIDLTNGKVKARIKPRHQLRNFSVDGKYLRVDEKLYESIEVKEGKVLSLK